MSSPKRGEEREGRKDKEGKTRKERQGRKEKEGIDRCKVLIE